MGVRHNSAPPVASTATSTGSLSWWPGSQTMAHGVFTSDTGLVFLHKMIADVLLRSDSQEGPFASQRGRTQKPGCCPLYAGHHSGLAREVSMPPVLELIQLLQPHVGFQERRHQHEVCELLVPVNGHYRVHDDSGRELLATLGQAVLHPPGATHVPLVRREADFTAYLLQWRHGPSLPAQSSRVLEDPAGRLLHGSAWLWDLRRAERDVVVDSLLRVLVDEVRALLEAKAQTDIDSIDRIRAYIDDNVGFHWGLAELAHAAGMSIPSLQRHFRRRFGISPMRYLRQRRLELAIKLLHETRSPIAAVARRVGVRNPAWFSRWIKESTGATPRAIRHHGPSAARKGDPPDADPTAR